MATHGKDIFRYSARYPDIAKKEMQLTPAATEMLERRDQELEDWLKRGAGREYATVVVAAADTHRDGKTTANFVCEGANDELVLEAAIASLPLLLGVLPIGRIELLEGGYSLSDGVDASAGFVELTGQGRGATFIQAADGAYAALASFLRVADLSLTCEGDTAGLQGVGATDRVNVSTVDGACVENVTGTTGHRYSNSGFSSVSAPSLLSLGASEFDVLNCSLSYPSIGILATAPAAVTYERKVSGCRLDDSGSSALAAIDITGDGVGGWTVRDVIENNKFEGSPTDYIRLTSTRGARVIGNTFDVPDEYAVELVTVHDSLVMGNNFRDPSPGFHNVLIDTNSDRNAVTANRCAAGSVRIDDSTCDSNNVIPALNPGFSLTDNGTGTVKTIASGSLPTAPPLHASTHYSGASDPLTGSLDANARVGVRKNSTGSTHLRRRVNFIEGSNVTLTVSDDSGSEEVDVTIASTATGVTPDVQVFTSDGTWTKPSGGQTRAKVIIIGAGGGPGSGKRGASGAARGGGGPGGPGGYVELDIPLSALSATQGAAVGTAGTAGAGVTANDTDGNAGTSGEESTFAGYSAGGGTGGAGGTTSNGAAGSAGSGLHAAASGGAGGSIDASDNLVTGVAGSASSWGLAGGAAG